MTTMTDPTLTIPQTAPPATTDEPRFALPTARLVLAAIAVAAGCAGTWTVIALTAGWDVAVARSGWLGALVVAVVMVVSVLAIRPWKARTLPAWMSAWVASMGLRLLLTPVGALLLYSAAALSPEAMAISVALAYLLSLLAETAVLANYVSRQTGSWRTAPGARWTGRG